jgi:hypothetical protein
MEKILKILLFASDPLDGKKLNLAEEVKEIEKSINFSPRRELIQLKVIWNASPEDLLPEICFYHPQIVHYSGRGTKNGLIMHGKNKKSRLLDIKKLSCVLEQVKEEVVLLFLNSCFSSFRSQLLLKDIDQLVLIEGYADDKAAVMFPGFFYRYLALGYPAEKAMNLAKAELLIRNVKKGYKPLYFSNKPENINYLNHENKSLKFISSKIIV